MTPAEIFRCLRDLGVAVRLDGGRPRLVGDVGCLHPELLAEVTRDRDGVVRFAAALGAALAAVRSAAPALDRRYPRSRLGSLVLALALGYHADADLEMLEDAAALDRRYPRSRLGSLVAGLALGYHADADLEMLADAAALCRRLLGEG